MSGERPIVTAGIDVGTSSVKVALFRTSGDGKEELLSKVVERIRRRDPKVVARHCYDLALADAKLRESDVVYVASTGEGSMVDFRRGHFYGMTTHARGAVYLCPGVTGVMDIGSLHARAIKIDPAARVLGYRMTSQCASGTGQFVENIARYLGVTLEEVGALSLQATKPEKPSGICAVLAETDVINMVSRGIARPDILRGIHESMAERMSKLLRSAGVHGKVALTGGLASDIGMQSALNAQVHGDRGDDLELVTHPDAILAGAMGAALWAAVRHRKIAARKGPRGAEAVA